MKFSRRVFMLAAVYGVLALLPMYFQESMVARMQPPAITHAEYYYGFIGVALAWQWAFVLIARDPLRHRTMMLPATLEKLAFGIAALALYLQHRLSLLMLGAGGIDLLFAALFIGSYWRTREGARVQR
ncbi:MULTISPECIES: hypothetical protein [Rhodanobacter]|uniref:Transmembrane protein n=2 Tax=Rhodanobacter TaxID=75309 RepID=I4W4G6_9GAMM|nr:hypothetical protein [Rhodanobacter spathiphylli]EIL94357.1 hypothetical protein UU7_05137 [Rhodanobacter spathiphylli B39]